MHVRTEAPRLDVVARDVPARYVDLCAALLRKSASERASLGDVARVLGSELPSMRGRM